MNYKNLSLIGTSHIAQQSVQEVRAAISDDVDVVAVELDRQRLHALLHKQKSKFSIRDIRKIGLTGFIFAVFGAWAQKKLGEVVGVIPGSEMLTAIKLAKENKIPIALIDQDITITLRRLSSTITWKEKLRFPYDAIYAIIFRKKEMKRAEIGHKRRQIRE